MSQIKIDSYGDVMAVVNDLELVDEIKEGDYQGDWLVTLTDGERLFYYTGRYGSCSGCDWIEAERDWKTGTIDYKTMVDAYGDLKPLYIVPKDKPLEFEYIGYKFKLKEKSDEPSKN